jgi:hypothetical protein
VDPKQAKKMKINKAKKDKAEQTKLNKVKYIEKKKMQGNSGLDYVITVITASRVVNFGSTKTLKLAVSLFREN